MTLGTMVQILVTAITFSCAAIHFYTVCILQHHQRPVPLIPCLDGVEGEISLYCCYGIKKQSGTEVHNILTAALCRPHTSGWLVSSCVCSSTQSYWLILPVDLGLLSYTYFVGLLPPRSRKNTTYKSDLHMIYEFCIF